MAKATFHKLSDGFPARDAASWSEEKLMILDGYLGGGKDRKGGFAEACKPAGGWYGLDLFAGTGLNYSLTRDEPIDGSARIALRAGEPNATRVLLAEKDERAFRALTHRTSEFGDRAMPFSGDANQIVRAMLAEVPRRAPAFAFLDPEGSELDWATVDAIADHKRASKYKIEQLILFPTDMGFVRLAPEYPELVTRIFGHDRWTSIYERREANKISAETARSEYVRLYAEGFKELGYESVLDRQIKKGTGHPMYFLIFATDNDAGEKIMNWVFDRVRLRVQEELGQSTLFKMPSGPRQRRLSGGES